MSLPAPRPDLAALDGYHSPQLSVDVRLNTNESPFPPPPAFVDAWLGRLADAPLHRYPDRAAGALRAGIGAHLGQPIERVFAANGSNEVLQTLLLAYGGPGRSALVFEPTYALHSHICRITGTGVRTGERTADFAISPTEARVLIEAERPAVVFVCSPNNPTGTVEPRATIEAILAAAIDHGPGLVVVDEAYGEFADFSALELVADDVPLVVSRTYSKVWSLAALRLGFCVAPASIVEELDKVVLPYHLSTATQTAGVAALDFRAEMDARVEALVDERHRLAETLTRLPGLTVYPSGANFVLIKSDGDGHALWERLVARGVLVRDFSRWPRLDDCLRITVGTPEENDRCIAALRASLEA
ncbi:MAG: histidinol-phosphate transaminase [Actinobacteria bacterium]|nr:histidinol-phosphate transaminase [Actinomycetota bacterium]